MNKAGAECFGFIHLNRDYFHKLFFILLIPFEYQIALVYADT